MISEAYSMFFRKLKKNNDKEWFHANKNSYQKDVKQPFIVLVESLIPDLLELNPKISKNPKDALFRINRDLRFSKDKTPYNTLMKAGFASGGNKSKLPGFYLGISAEHIHAGGGLFNLNGPDLKLVRTAIADNTKEFMNIVTAKSFKEKFDGLKGEQAKRIDKKFQPILEQTSLIANKQFYVMSQFALAEYLNSDKLREVILDHFRVIHPLNEFLKKALS